MKSSSSPPADRTRVASSPIPRNLVAALLLAGLVGPAALVWPVALARPALAAPFEIVVLQGMDKVTARVSTIEAPVGEVVTFGALEIIARTCDKRPPEETPESAVFLDIWEVHQGEPAVSLFRGWMFGSSPALSAMEHPVYDVWVVDCKNKSSSAAETSGFETSPKKAP